MSETPEILWNDSLRYELRQAVTQIIAPQLTSYFDSNTSSAFRINPPNFSVKYQSLAQEIQIDGVFLRKFIEHPQPSMYLVHDPASFIQGCLSLLHSIISDASKADAARYCAEAALAVMGGTQYHEPTTSDIAAADPALCTAPFALMITEFRCVLFPVVVLMLVLG